MASELTTLREDLLAQLAVEGSRAAFGELTRRALPGVRSLLRRIGAEPALADDLAQDAFLAAYRAIASYRGEGAFGGWVSRIAVRLYFRRVRQFRQERWEPLPEEFDVPITAAGPAERIDLDQALATLSAMERLCVTLCHGAGFTHEELAREMQLPLGTVKSHVLRGTRRLRARLGVVTGSGESP